MMNPTFGSGLQAVGTAAALASAGVYLHRSKYVTMDNKIVLARYSQQIAIPALLFSKFIPCPKSSSYQEQPLAASAYDQYAEEDGSASSFCPNVWQHVVLGRQHAWIFLLWPLFVVSCGLLVGMIAVRVTRTPQKYHGAVLAATAFANSSGLPLTLLASIMAHAGPGARGNASSHQSDNPEIKIEMDPNIFLSFYLCTYPILQWGVGGWLISQRENGGESTGPVEVRQEAIDNSNSRGDVNCSLHVKNCPAVDSNETQRSTNSMDVKNAFQGVMTDRATSRPNLNSTGTDHKGISSMLHADQGDNIELGDSNSMLIYIEDEEMNRLMPPMVRALEVPEPPSLISSSLPVSSSAISEKEGCAGRIAARLLFAMVCSTIRRCTQILGNIAIKAWQPPVMGAVAGLFVASIPALRSLLVVMQPAPANHRPLLQWVFDAIVAIGQSAIPVNMTVLGANLSLEAATATTCNASIGAGPSDRVDNDRVHLINHARGNMLLSLSSAAPSTSTLQQSTIAAVVVGKLLIMPLIGISSTILLRRLVPTLFANQSPSFYLVLMLVFATPTATNIMVISDIYKGEQGMARLIGCQYIAAPIFLALSLMAILRVSGF